MRAAGVGVYIQSDIKAFDSYFTATPPADFSNIYGNSSTSIHVSATFENTLDSNGNNPVANPYLNGTSIHELAHQLDAQWGNPSQKTGANTWGAAISADIRTGECDGFSAKPKSVYDGGIGKGNARRHALTGTIA